LFGLSAFASFLAPVAVKYKEQPESPIHVEVLTPIEENDEYEYDENDQPITMSKFPLSSHLITSSSLKKSHSVLN